MDLLDRTLATAAENLALDEALLLQAEVGGAGEVLRLWEWPTREPDRAAGLVPAVRTAGTSPPAHQPSLAVVLGSGCKLHDDVDSAACLADGVPILRRSSGGGTVLLGRGCLCFSLVLAFDRDPRLTEVRSSYHFILGRTLDAFGLPGMTLSGISDLALGGYKFSGNAQQRKRHHLLHHGTILYAFDLAAVSHYLRQPSRQPEYRAGRPHGDFLRNLDRPRDWIADRLRAAWEAETPRTEVPADLVARLVGEKYSSPGWTERR